MQYRPNFKKYAAYTAQLKAEAEIEFRMVETQISSDALGKKLRRLYPGFYTGPKVPPS